MTLRTVLASGLVALVAAGTAAAATGPVSQPADYVLTGARIYTEDARHAVAEALAVRGDKLVFVGAAEAARALIGPATRVEDGHGRLVLPGLVDAHIHPAGIVDLDVCSLESRAVSLDELAPFIKACVSRYHIAPGEWVAVQQWDFTNGNQPSAANPTLRAALDHASEVNPVTLIGNDGHHGAYNSLALARARAADGRVIGFSRASLRSGFARFQKLVGVDEAGEPNGAVNEDARQAMDAPDLLSVNFVALMTAPERVPERLNSVGVTAIQDAMVTPAMLPFYDALLAGGKMTVRANLMQFYEPEAFAGGDGRIDYDRLLDQAKAVRRKYAGSELVRAEGVKIFADGVLEGNPYASPPTLPDSPSLKPYLQPIFARDAAGALSVAGYVDPQSPACLQVRADPDRFASAAAVQAFVQAHGHHPAQCAISSGKLQHDRQVILDYARRAHLAGFTLHIHAIGDAAVRTAVDAIEGARAADQNDRRPDTIAHLQLVSPDDVARIGHDHLFLAYTYSWMVTAPAYDMSVIPFFERVSGAGYQALHHPDFYYERQFYPARATMQAGAILAAGSDAPVNTRDPQPFVNMQIGVTRAVPSLPAANPAERLDIRDLIDAYTIHGAQAMGRSDTFGSLEVGKSADFIILDRDIIALADTGRPEEIGGTRVLETWFMGRRVWAAPAGP